MMHQRLQLQLVLQFVLFSACARDLGMAGQGSLDWSKDHAHERREVLELVCSLRGDWEPQCSRRGCVWPDFAWSLSEVWPLSASSSWAWVILHCRNRLITLRYSVQVALLGLDQGNRDCWANSNWHFLKEKCNMEQLPRFLFKLPFGLISMR